MDVGCGSPIGLPSPTYEGLPLWTKSIALGSLEAGRCGDNVATCGPTCVQWREILKRRSSRLQPVDHRKERQVKIAVRNSRRRIRRGLGRTFLFGLGLLVLAIGLPGGAPAQNESPLARGRKYTTIERLAPARLAAVANARQQWKRQRQPVPLRQGLTDYRAILHAHAEDSAHTGGTRPELLAAAQRTGVSIVMLTDHVRPPRDFISDSWRGLREGVLFLPGAESEGFLAYPTRSILDHYQPRTWSSREAFIDLVRAAGGNIFLSHVEEKGDWPTHQLDGLEIYNNHTDMMDERAFLIWLRSALTDPARVDALSQSLRDYPLEVFGALQDYLPPLMTKWDRDLLSHHLTGIAANDCHHNQVYDLVAVADDALELRIIGDPPRRITTAQSPQIAPFLANRSAGDLIARLDLDPYESSLQFVTTHLLLPTLTEPAVREALRKGRAYVAHDWLCDPTGFAFVAEGPRQQRLALMGDQIPLRAGLTLRLEAPLESIVRLYHNGKLLREDSTRSFRWAVQDPGVYRAELWLPLDGEERPWIYANPIRILPSRR
jgi:hypothetical protein